MKKALIVDDTKNIRILLTTCLELNGYDVTTANNGQQALEEFNKDKFDLAFLDIKMPELSGTEVLRKIRESGINTPVIIMTAFATVKNAVECTKLGAVTYLQKPFTADKVKMVLKEIYEGKVEDVDINDCIKRSKEMLNSGMIDESYELLKKGLSIEPANSEIYFLIGKVYEKREDAEQARKFYAASKQFQDED
jgi:two-component system, OmpR family, response regulator